MKPICKAPKHPLQVILGSQTIKAFVAAPKEFRVIGIVRIGMEFGLLAQTAGGNFVRVNGSTVQALSNQAVEDAIALARLTGRGESYAMSRSHHGARPPAGEVPVVTRKRRRLVAAPLAHQPAMELEPESAQALAA